MPLKIYLLTKTSIHTSAYIHFNTGISVRHYRIPLISHLCLYFKHKRVSTDLVLVIGEEYAGDGHIPSSECLDDDDSYGDMSIYQLCIGLITRIALLQQLLYSAVYICVSVDVPMYACMSVIVILIKSCWAFISIHSFFGVFKTHCSSTAHREYQ